VPSATMWPPRSAEALGARLERAAVRDRDLDQEVAEDRLPSGARGAKDRAATRPTQTAPAIGYPKREEIFLATLEGTMGGESASRPTIVLPNDTSNRWSVRTLVAPPSSTARFPLHPPGPSCCPSAHWLSPPLRYEIRLALPAKSGS
jgi:hypothetical protein